MARRTQLGGDPHLSRFGVQRLLGLPLTAWIAIACFVVFSLIMGKTRFGRHLIIIGGNPAVSHMSLISEPRVLQKLDAIAERDEWEPDSGAWDPPHMDRL